MKRNITSLSVLMAVGLGISPANAAITLDAFTDGSDTTRNATNQVTLSGFNATTSDKLVVLAGAASASANVVSITSVTYNGVALNQATQGSSAAGSSSFRTSGIFYLDKDDFSGAGDIVVTFNTAIFVGNGSNGGYDIGAFALSGTAAGFDAGNSDNGTGNNGTSATINVTQVGSFVAAVNSYGNLSAPAGMTELGGADPLTRAFQEDVAAGSFTADFGGGNVTSVASFAIPEPSAALLGGIGLLALLRRRR